VTAKSTHGARIIFPWEKNRSSINRFLAIFGDEPYEKLRAIGSDLEKTVQKEFSLMANVILDRLHITKPAYYDEQISNYWDIFWLFEKCDDGCFAQAYQKAERNFGAIKNIRHFSQFEQPPARKCSVTGEHNVLFYRNKDRQGSNEFAVGVPEFVPLKYLGLRERIGAIAFVKRGAEQYFSNSNGYQRDFPSTAEIALMDILDEWDDELPAQKVEPELLFEINNKRPIPEGVSPEEWKRAQQVYKILKSHYVDFSPYYALVHFDGDNMGKWLGGNFLREGISLAEFQKEFSRELGQFAEQVRDKLVTPPRGITVYAGGDDFLGFVNLKYLLDVLRELRCSFERIDLTKYTDKKHTFSAGVVIAHYRDPLGEVLNWARKMERRAKNIGDEKDSLALAVLKRSGEVHQSVYRWRCAEGWIVDYIDLLIDKIKEKNGTTPPEFSDNFIRTIHQEFVKLLDENGNISDIAEEKLVFTEARRLLARSCMLLKEHSETKQEFAVRKQVAVGNMTRYLKELYLHSVSLDNFFSLLHIANFISREVSR